MSIKVANNRCLSLFKITTCDKGIFLIIIEYIKKDETDTHKHHALTLTKKKFQCVFTNGLILNVNLNIGMSCSGMSLCSLPWQPEYNVTPFSEFSPFSAFYSLPI